MRRSTLKDPSKESWDIIILAGQSNAEGSGFGPASKAWYPDDGEALYQLGHRYFRMFQTL